MTCPRCRKGVLFQFRGLVSPSKILAMKKCCGVCGLKYMIEPSFYFGAMYVAYAISVMVALTVFLWGSNVFHWGIKSNLSLVFGVLLITAPFQLRLSRSIWIHIFVKYDNDEK